MKKAAKKPGEAESVPATIPKPRFFGNWTGKLPVNILSEHIQREKWDKPNYRFKSVAKGHLCWIKLKRRNNKTGGWDEVEFTSYDYYPSEQLAKHSTATYVLHRLLSNRNIHSILPPLMRELWQKYDKEKKEMDPDIVRLHYTSNPFEIKQVEKEVKFNQKKEPFEDYPSIHIPKDLSERLEALLRSNLEHVVFDQEEPDLNIVNQNLEKMLIGKGFRMGHAREALQYCKNLNEAISWLCIHCPEDDLPKDMKPTDNRSMVFSNLSIDDLKVSLSLERLMCTGASRTQCLKHLKMKEGDEYLAAGSLCLELAGVTDLDIVDSVETFETAVMDEIEALQSIFSDNLNLNTSPTGLALSFDVELAGKLDIVISCDSKYPNVLPGVILVGKDLPAYIKLAILQKVIRETVLHIGSPMIYTIVDFVKLYTPIILDQPPPLLSLYQIAHPIRFGSTTPALREKQSMRKIESSRTNSPVKEMYDELLKSTAYLEMLNTRKKLPAYNFKHKICSYLDTSQAVIICGETGSGKSTQVGQFILENKLDNGVENFNIICTQPRRISAISLAERVAAERGDIVGNLVGYSVRGEYKQSVNTRLTFCTTGILFRMMQSDKNLSQITHVIVDEVHERGLESDFLLILLRDLLNSRKDIKVILMSATIESSLFSSYFGCAVFEIPGFTHPVTDVYLETILKVTSYRPSNINSKFTKRVNSEESDEENVNESDNITLKKLRRLEKDKNFMIDYGLIAHTVKYICETSSGGAILIFLPGIMEIKKCIDEIQRVLYNVWDTLQVYPLHSNLTSKEQTSVFKRLPPNKRKIVVSTNIAETSVTIDDVEFVVDTGRVKEMVLIDNVLTLTEVWASAAACKQRRGRAGRVKAGTAYKLFTATFSSKHMAAYTKPEILRLPLEQVCLLIKSLGIADVAQFLQRALTPPPIENVQNSMNLLEDLQALDSDHNITPLGKNISRIPADIRIAKMLIFGCIFKCLDTVLCVATYLGGKSPLITSYGRREEAAAAHRKFINNLSDHLTVCEVFNQWQKSKKSSNSSAWTFCEQNFVSMTVMDSMADLRKQFLGILIEIGYASKDSWKDLNANSNNEKIVKAVLLNGLEIAGIQVPSQSYVDTVGGAMAVDSSSKDVKYFANGERVFIHPTSVLFHSNRYEEGSCIVYGSKVKTSKIFIRDCSAVSPMALLLFGSKVTPLFGGKSLQINGIRYQSFPRNLALITGMRKLLDKALNEKFNNPASDILNTDFGELCYDLLR